MPVTLTPTQRGLAAGVAVAALLIGAFAAGTAQGGGAAPAAAASRTLAVQAADAAGGKITVTGTGGVSGTPDQLTLSMGVQTTGYSVSESIQVTLRTLGTAGTQISDAVRAGGNAVEVDGVSLNLSDTGSLL